MELYLVNRPVLEISEFISIQTFIVQQQTNAISKSCSIRLVTWDGFDHIHCITRNIGRIQSHITRNLGGFRSHILEDACSCMISCYTKTSSGFGNTLMYGVNVSSLSKFQRVHNTTARLLTRKKKFEHLTPTRMILH